MASTSLSVVTATLAGASITAKTGLASSQTMTLNPTTSQGALDFASLHVRVENTNSTASVTLSLAAGDDYSAKGIGAKSISVSTEATVIIGGQDFEGARFEDEDGYIIFTQTGAGPTSWEAYQAPRASE